MLYGSRSEYHYYASTPNKVITISKFLLHLSCSLILVIAVLTLVVIPTSTKVQSCEPIVIGLDQLITFYWLPLITKLLRGRP